jgi:hypothetical protein
VSVVVRTTQLEVFVDGDYDASAYAATCSFGFDQRYAEATVRRTGGGTVSVSYWSLVEIRMGTTPGEGAATRFYGYVIPVDNALYPIENVLTCKGRLYRAAFARNNRPGGTDYGNPGHPSPTYGGQADEETVRQVLTACGVPYLDGDIEGTGKALGSAYLDLDGIERVMPGPFTWAEQQSGLDFIEQLDEVSVPDDASGRYRTYERPAGQVVRTKLSGAPASAADWDFAEGEDVLEARITRDPAGAANRVVVTGAAYPLALTVAGGGLDVQFSAQTTFTAASEFAPYLPPGLPDGPEGFPCITYAFSSPLIEKSTIAQTDPDGNPLGDVLSCEAVAQLLLAERNCVVDTLTFSTPRDDVLAPGQAIHLHSPRLGITDAGQHYWLQHLEVTLDERGAFTQRLTCVRRS